VGRLPMGLEGVEEEKSKEYGVELAKKNIAVILEKLEQSPLNLENITDSSEVKLLLGQFGLRGVVMRAMDRFEKWMNKVGSKLNKRQQEKMRKAIFVNATIEEAVRRICGFYGIGGAEQLVYMNLGRKVFHIIAKSDIRTWTNKLQNLLLDWRRNYKIDKRVGHLVIVVTSKIAYDTLYSG